MFFLRNHLTTKEQRRRIERVLRKNPGLKNYLEEAFENAYGDARLIASRESGLEETTFPDACPWSLERIMDPEFWP